MEPDLTAALAALERVLPPQRPVPLHEPAFGNTDKALVLDCLESGWVSSVGTYVDRFEAELACHTGVAHAVCTVNGTAALHTCYGLAGVGPGDEVLLPALTFVATCNPVAYLGAVPHFVDCDPRTLGVDPVKLDAYLEQIAELRDGRCYNRRSGRRLAALVVVHLLGHPAELPALVALAERWHLVLIEDAAESLGSLYAGRHTGGWGRLAALSFNGNKIITTGGGGAVLTNDPELARRAKHLTTTARTDHPLELAHDQVAYNYRMPNLNAALGCAQLERLPHYLEAKRRLAGRYAEAFADVPGVRLFREAAQARSNQWLNLILLDGPKQRDALLRATHAAGILTRPLWTLLHRLPMYRDCPRMDLGACETLAARGVCLPSSPALAGGEAA